MRARDQEAIAALQLEVAGLEGEFRSELELRATGDNAQGLALTDKRESAIERDAQLHRPRQGIAGVGGPQEALPELAELQRRDSSVGAS